MQRSRLPHQERLERAFGEHLDGVAAYTGRWCHPGDGRRASRRCAGDGHLQRPRPRPAHHRARGRPRPARRHRHQEQFQTQDEYDREQAVKAAARAMPAPKVAPSWVDVALPSGSQGAAPSGPFVRPPAIAPPVVAPPVVAPPQQQGWTSGQVASMQGRKRRPDLNVWLLGQGLAI